MKDVSDLTLERCIAIYNRRSDIKKLIESIGHRLTAELEKGTEVPGYKLVVPLANRQWTIEDEEQLVQHLRGLGFLKRDCVQTVTKIASPHKLEQLAREKDADGNLVRPKLEELDLSPITKRAEKDPICVPESDKREAYVPSEPDLSNIPEY